MENKLREVREAKGLTTLQLSEKSGVTRQTIYLIEHGLNKSVMLKTMVALATALEVPLNEILIP